MLDTTSQTFGLPSCVLVPIASRSIDAIEKYVGRCLEEKRGRDGRIKTLLIQPHTRPDIENSRIPLWKEKKAMEYYQRLHPERQVWVHVDYNAYRKAYIGFEMPPISPGYILDHIQNRESVRLNDYSHPYIRLCPVSCKVNSSSGHNSGSEGMEKAFLRTLPTLSAERRKDFDEVNACQIIYADPIDICKMLNFPPGTKVLPGVAQMIHLLYPTTK